eukprot:m.98517 g.98517  ORF g.98517 m.98517 type:complete len:74 (+) comp51408_c0_seq2:1804-2025(+)
MPLEARHSARIEVLRQATPTPESARDLCEHLRLQISLRLRSDPECWCRACLVVLVFVPVPSFSSVVPLRRWSP